MRFIFYSHYGMGLGNAHRNLEIAVALVDLEPQASVLLATGTGSVNHIYLPSNVEFLRLPGICKLANNSYTPRRLSIPHGDLWELRSTLLTAAVHAFRPDVMLVDKHPLGARGELCGALEVLRARGGRAVLGLRDILDDKSAVHKEWTPEDLEMWVKKYYERVLIYGSRRVFDSVAEYAFPRFVSDRTRFCGYVINQPEPPKQDTDRPFEFTVEAKRRPVVLATADGEEDGFPLFQLFTETSKGAPWSGVVVAGPNASKKEQQVLHRKADEAGVAFHRYVPGLSRYFVGVDSLVCMGGYNMVAEAVSKGTPTVCVPHTSPRFEQLIRARTFAALGLLRSVEPDELNVRNLRREVTASLSIPRQDLKDRAHTILDFNGARQAASHLLELAESQRNPVAE